MALDFPKWLRDHELTDLPPEQIKLLEHAHYGGYSDGYKDSFNFGKMLEEKRAARKQIVEEKMDD